MVRLFLRFATGSSTVPHKGNWQIRIEKSEEHHSLPNANSCFRTIRIPIYGTYDILAKNMRFGLLEGNEGYAFG